MARYTNWVIWIARGCGEPSGVGGRERSSSRRSRMASEPILAMRSWVAHPQAGKPRHGPVSWLGECARSGWCRCSRSFAVNGLLSAGLGEPVAHVARVVRAVAVGGDLAAQDQQVHCSTQVTETARHCEHQKASTPMPAHRSTMRPRCGTSMARSRARPDGVKNAPATRSARRRTARRARQLLHRRSATRHDSRDSASCRRWSGRPRPRCPRWPSRAIHNSPAATGSACWRRSRRPTRWSRNCRPRCRRWSTRPRCAPS